MSSTDFEPKGLNQASKSTCGEDLTIQFNIIHYFYGHILIYLF